MLAHVGQGPLREYNLYALDWSVGLYCPDGTWKALDWSVGPGWSMGPGWSEAKRGPHQIAAGRLI